MLQRASCLHRDFNGAIYIHHIGGDRWLITIRIARNSPLCGPWEFQSGLRVRVTLNGTMLSRKSLNFRI